AAVALAVDSQTPSRAGRECTVRAAIKTVAAYLGNTPAVCQASYVDPRVIDRYHAGVTIAETLDDVPKSGPDLADARVRGRIEAAVVELLAGTGDRPRGRLSHRRKRNRCQRERTWVALS